MSAPMHERRPLLPPPESATAQDDCHCINRGRSLIDRFVAVLDEFVQKHEGERNKSNEGRITIVLDLRSSSDVSGLATFQDCVLQTQDDCQHEIASAVHQPGEVILEVDYLKEHFPHLRCRRRSQESFRRKSGEAPFEHARGVSPERGGRSPVASCRRLSLAGLPEGRSVTLPPSETAPGAEMQILVRPLHGIDLSCLRTRDEDKLVHSGGRVVHLQLALRACASIDDLSQLVPNLRRVLKSRHLHLVSSPLSAITLAGGERLAVGVPPTACFSSFCFPWDTPNKEVRKVVREVLSNLHSPLLSGHACDNQRTFTSWMLHGAFLYFDANFRVVEVSAVDKVYSSAPALKDCQLEIPHATRNGEIVLGEENAMEAFSVSSLDYWDRWFRTSPSLKSLSTAFSECTWVIPSEVLGDYVFGKYGGFAFRRRDGSVVYRALRPHSREQVNITRRTHSDMSIRSASLAGLSVDVEPAQAQVAAAHAGLVEKWHEDLLEAAQVYAERMEDGGLPPVQTLDDQGAPGQSRAACCFDPNEPITWKDGLLPRLEDRTEPERVLALQQLLRARQFATQHGLISRATPRILVRLEGFYLEDSFAERTEQRSFKEMMYPEDKYDLTHNHGATVRFFLECAAVCATAHHDVLHMDAFRSVAGIQSESEVYEVIASSVNTLTLPEHARIRAGIPRTAQFYAFCYPLSTVPMAEIKCKDTALPLDWSDPLLNFLCCGAYLYFDSMYDIVAINAFASDIESHPRTLLYFSPSMDLPWNTVEPLEQAGRWRLDLQSTRTGEQETQFAWINPSEVLMDRIFCGHGGFAFRTRSWRTCSDCSRTPGEWKCWFQAVVGDVHDCDQEIGQAYQIRHYECPVFIPAASRAAPAARRVHRSAPTAGTLRASTAASSLQCASTSTPTRRLGASTPSWESANATCTSSVDAIRAEFEDEYKTGDGLVKQEDLENVRYVLDEPAQELEVMGNEGVEKMRDEGNNGKRLRDFHKMRQSVAAGLSLAEVAALRIYTTSSFRAILAPLRGRGARKTSHPLAATTHFISTGLKKLRACHEWTNFRPKYLWRGLRNTVIDDQFRMEGGTEMACMSTTEDVRVAAKYCESIKPLLFRIRVKSPMELGGDISWLSAFASEREVLYPPLTYLKYLYEQEMARAVHAGTVITVEPSFPS